MTDDDLRFVTGGALLSGLFSNDDSPAGFAELEPGTRLGAFAVIELIGTGGSGAVYLAERSDGTFAQRVAVKLIAAADPANTSVRQECEVLASLTHPAIARILDGGELAEGELWFAMELVEGMPIDQHCESRALDWRARLDLLVTVVEAIAHAHAREIVHRDIKPGNVLVDREGHVKLIDFGIALRRSEDGREGPALFTPGYASPEQWQGKPITPATDIYQLGLLLSELFTPPAGSTIPSLPSMLRMNIDAVVARAMQVRPESRYESAAHLGEDLRRVQAGLPSKSRSWDPLQHLRFLCARHPRSSRAVAAFLPILTLVIVWGALQVRSARDAASAQSRQAQATGEVLRGLIREADPSLNQGDRLQAIVILDHAAAQLSARNGLSDAMRLDLVTDVVELYNEANEPDKAIALGDGVLTAVGSGHELDVSRARLLAMLGDCETSLSHYDEAGRRLDQATALIDHLPREQAAEERDLIDLIRASILLMGHDEARARVLLHGVIDGFEKSGRTPDRMLFLAYETLGGSYQSFEPGPEKALEYLSRAQTLGAQVLGPHHRWQITNAIRLGGALGDVHRTEEAIATLEGAIAAARNIPERNGPNHALMAFAYRMEASAYRVAKDYPACIRAADNALAEYDAVAGDADEYRIDPLSIGGRCRVKAGQSSEAIPAFARSLAIRRRVYGDMNPFSVADAVYDLGDAQLAAGDIDGANATLDAVPALSGKVAGASPQWFAENWILLARARLSAHRNDEARIALEQADRHIGSDRTTMSSLAKQIDALRASLTSRR